MKIGHRLTIAITTVVLATVALFLYFEFQTRRLEREDRLINRAEELALALRSAVELAGYPVNQNDAEAIASELTKSRTPWSVRIFSVEYLQSAPQKPWTKRAETILTQKSEKLILKDINEYLVVLPLRATTDQSPKGFRISGTIELAHPTLQLYEENKAELQKFIAVILLLLLLLLVSGLGISKILINRPIRKLLAGVGDVAQGDLSPVLLAEREDEIGELAARFNAMTQSLRESRAETIKQDSARTKLENQLFKTEKLATIGQIAAEIAHEVGTPLNVIAGRARTLAKKVEDRDAVLKNSEIIAEQTDRITRIIQRLLDFSRRKVGVVEKASVDLNGLIAKTMTFLEGKLKNANITTLVTLTTQSTTVRGNPDELQQVFLNILINAIEAMLDGGELNVQSTLIKRRRQGLEMSPKRDFVHLAFWDTGPGIPIHMRDAIFEPFYSTKQSQGGTGLGLAVVFGIVKDHDGWIEITDAKDKGACFNIFFPHHTSESKQHQPKL